MRNLKIEMKQALGFGICDGLHGVFENGNL